MRCLQHLTILEKQPGLTLVEMLIALALMSFVLLSTSNFLFGMNLRSASLNGRFKLATEIHTLVQDIQDDLHRGAYISPNSFRNRLEYTTYEPNSGDAVKKVYGICYYSSVQNSSTDTTCPLQGGGGTFPYLKLSLDGGATWASPYRISGFNKYRLNNASGPRFLFAQASNNCIDYVDNNGNGVLGSGDSTQTQVSCGTGGNSWFGVTSSSLNPTYASKVILNNFNFTTGTGSPETVRNLPQYLFIALAPGPVRSNMAAVAPGVKDTQLVQSFSFDNAVNSLWPSGFLARDLDWDAAHERLIIGNTDLGILYQTERNGVFINAPITLANGDDPPAGVAIEEDGNTLHTWHNNFYSRYNLNGTNPLQPTYGPVSRPNSFVARRHMAFDPITRNLYMAEWDTSDNSAKISPYYGSDSSSGGLSTGGSVIPLPNAFTSQLQVGGLVIEPLNGDFLVAHNLVYTSGGNNYIDIYRIDRDDTSVITSFAVNLTDLGSTATGASGGFDMAYDAVLNRLFLADNASKRIYEVVPVKLISPRI